MSFGFEWDTEKAASNQRKHGVSFDEAQTVFGDPFARTRPDPRHSPGEERWITLGVSEQGRLLVVVHADRGEVIRIISARPATGHERRTYAESRWR
ncbi:MAG TPA: BrnT family toxin [Longimicrobium sp.]|nr:BrnT family toxin [Longimicrobium sp.]